MSTRLVPDRARRVAICLTALLAAGCGGGGGGSTSVPPPELIQITAQNEDAVARVTAATFFSMTGVSSMTMPAPPAPAKASGVSDVAARALGVAVAPARRADAKVRLMAVASVTEQCAFGGTVTVTIDDRDGNGFVSAGDLMTIVFAQCKPTATSLTDGTLAFAVTGASATPTTLQLNGTFTFQQMTMVDDGYTSAINGSTEVVYTESVDAANTLTVRVDMTVTAGGLVAAGSTPRFTDTFTYDAGFRAVTTDVMPTLATPHSTAALDGTVHSASLGGRIRLETDPMNPIHDTWGQEFPDSGKVTIHGKASHLRLTVIDSVTVRCELDDDDDGAMEQSHEMLWTELMP